MGKREFVDKLFLFEIHKEQETCKSDLAPVVFLSSMPCF